MAKLKLYNTIFSKLSTLNKSDGQVIVSKDSKSLYIDSDGERVEITDWIDIDTEQDLLAILTPLSNKYYFTKDTNKVWRYIGSDWVCLNMEINDQTPTFTESSTITKLSSGEKISISFGKISKAISELIIHIGDQIKHITSTERTDWNAAKTHADSAHAPSNAQANVIETVKVNGTALTPSSKAVNVIVPTKVSDLNNDSGYTSNTGTITGIKMNGASKGTSGVVDLGTVITSHQDISGKQDKTDSSLSTSDKTVAGAINELNTELNLKKVNTYTALSQLGCTTNNTVEEVMDALPINSILSVGVAATSSNFYNSLPIQAAGVLFMVKGNNSGRGYAEFHPANKNYFYHSSYYNSTLNGFKQIAITSDLASYLPLSGGSLSGEIVIEKTDPYLRLTNTGGGSDCVGLHWYGSSSGNNGFGIYDIKNATHLMNISQSTKNALFYGSVYAGDYCRMFSDGEGGAVEVVSKSNGNTWQMDAYNGNLRFYTYDSNGNIRAIEIDKETGKIIADITGNAENAVFLRNDSNAYNKFKVRGYSGSSPYNGNMFIQQSEDASCVNIGIDGKGAIGVNKAKYATEAGYCSGNSATATKATTADTATTANTASMANRLGSTTIGDSATPIYLAGGAPSKCSSTVGSADTPVYMNNGTITTTGKKFSNYLPLAGGTVTGVLTVNNNTKAAQFHGLDSKDAYVVAGSSSNIVRLCGSQIQCNNTGISANVPIYASAFSQTSSRRYKENIEDLTLEDAKKLLELRPVTYDYINKANGTGCQGLIAEEVDEVMKYPVIYNDEGQPEGLDYSKFVPSLIKLVQEQEKRISELERTVKELSDRIAV